MRFNHLLDLVLKTRLNFTVQKDYSVFKLKKKHTHTFEFKFFLALINCFVVSVKTIPETPSH